MNAYLIRTANPSAYDPSNYRSVIRTDRLEGDTILDILHTENPLQPGDILIGAWGRDGKKTEPFDAVTFQQIRPLGNEPARDILDENGDVVGQTRGGNASRHLLYHHFAGWAQRNLGDDQATDPIERLYPADSQPFGVEIRHKEWTGQVDPGWNGWGWRAEILGGAASRDPSARAIGVYTDAECTAMRAQTGAFVLGASEWQVDENGDPLQVWYTETPLGRANPAKQDWHLAVLLGSAQEGYQTLEAGQVGIQYLFWDKTQGALPGEAWVDTGAVVTGKTGQMYYISDPAVAAALNSGRTIRFGDDKETTFVSIWAGTDNLLQIDPYVDGVQNGDKLWTWE